MTDHGAPLSLRMKAERTVQQEALISHVRTLEKQARLIVRELELNRDVSRQALLFGEGLIASGLTMLVKAITREDIL
jgi:hypothetical protein